VSCVTIQFAFGVKNQARRPVHKASAGVWWHRLHHPRRQDHRRPRCWSQRGNAARLCVSTP